MLLLCTTLFFKQLSGFLRTVNNLYDGIFWQRSVYISSDEGRLCRPLVIADKGISRIKEHHMKSLKV